MKVASTNQPTAVASAPRNDSSGKTAPPEPAMHPAGTQGREVPLGEPEDPTTSALRNAMQAHIESVVLDARRNAQKY
jgi:hypothetical protein